MGCFGSKLAEKVSSGHQLSPPPDSDKMKTIATKIPSEGDVPTKNESPQTVTSSYSAKESPYSSHFSDFAKSSMSIIAYVSPTSFLSHHSILSRFSNSSSGKKSDIVARNKNEFDQLVQSEKNLIVVDFYATWCGPCKAIAPFLQKWSEEFDDVTFVKIDVDENDETAEACGISAMPTFFLYKNGKKVDEIVGANHEKLREKIIANK